MFEAPGIFHALYRMVSPFVDHHTRSKIKFVYGKEAIAEFQREIPAEVCALWCLVVPAISGCVATWRALQTRPCPDMQTALPPGVGTLPQHTCVAERLVALP